MSLARMGSPSTPLCDRQKRQQGQTLRQLSACWTESIYPSGECKALCVPETVFQLLGGCMTVRELTEALEVYGDHVEVRVSVSTPTRDRVYSILDVTFNGQESAVDLITEEN